MKTISFFHKPILILLLCSVGLFANSDTDISFAGDPWPPFFTSTTGIYIDGGIGFEVTKEILGRIDGVAAVFPVVPWKRALLEVRHGMKDGITFLLKNRQREKYLLFSLPVAQAPALFFFSQQHLTEGFSWQSVEDLQGKRIGIVAGYSYGAFLDKLISSQQLSFIEINSSALGFRMLEKGRLDLFAESKPVGLRILKDQGWLNQAGWAEKKFNTDTYHIALSRKSIAKHFIKQINLAILAATHDGTIDVLLNSAGAASYPHNQP